MQSNFSYVIEYLNASYAFEIPDELLACPQCVLAATAENVVSQAIVLAIDCHKTANEILVHFLEDRHVRHLDGFVEPEQRPIEDQPCRACIEELARLN